ncbi:MAG: HD domain-containing phosphohydrolase [Gemmatimonadota bacterium]
MIYRPTLEEVRGARILVVDDEPANVELVHSVLETAGFTQLLGLTDPREVLALCRSEQPDIVILDLKMPHLDGFAVIRQLQSEFPEQFLPILVLTSDDSREAKQQALSSGARDFLTKPLSPSELRLRTANLIENRLLYKALEKQMGGLEELVQDRTSELEAARLEILERLATAAEYHDFETGEHTKRVGDLSAAIAEQLGLDYARIELVRQAAPLHDVGKIGIEHAILLKPGRLTPDEWETIKTHTVIGHEILSGSRNPLLILAASIALSHHECWDGTGYPNGLASTNIPLEARIVSVADVYDSLTHERPYKGAWSREEAEAEILSLKGSKFDTRVVDAFFQVQGSNAKAAPSPFGQIRSYVPREHTDPGVTG